MADLFQYRPTRQGPLYTAGLYVVYRSVVATGAGRTEDDIAEAHKVAVFVDGSEAADYCRYRNRLLAERGTDALSP